jgi:hypothetical protein
VTYNLLQWAHVLVMGYWLGSELVINALTHYVVRSTSLPAAERMRLWDFLLDVDQHVRNAMIMSVPLGFSLAALMGLVPLDDSGLIALWVASSGWFAFMWWVHLARKKPYGATLAKWDWRLRYVLIAFFAGTALYSLATGKPYTANWLALKVLLFAGAIVCGIFVRRYIREAYRSAIPAIENDRAGSAENEEFRVLMVKATWALVVLWLLLFTIGGLGALKPI